MMPSENKVLIAIELSVSSWFVAAQLPGSEKSRLHRVEGGDTTALLALIRDLRSRAETKLGHAADVACCFEAGRDAFGCTDYSQRTAPVPTCSSRPASS